MRDFAATPENYYASGYFHNEASDVQPIAKHTCGRGPIRDAERAVGLAKLGFDRGNGGTPGIGDLLVAVAAVDHCDNLQLGLGEGFAWMPN